MLSYSVWNVLNNASPVLPFAESMYAWIGTRKIRYSSSLFINLYSTKPICGPSIISAGIVSATGMACAIQFPVCQVTDRAINVKVCFDG